MKVMLWNELDDQQAEKVRGGEGIGEAVSTTNAEARALGFKNSNAWARVAGLKNFGVAVSEFAQETNGP